MKQPPVHHPPPPPPRQKRIPPFHAVPGKARADGWTPLKQAEFIGHLAETRCVSSAALRVGMARETAYRLRRRKWSDSFCAAWDAAMGNRMRPAKGGKSHTATPAKVTVAELEWRVASGIWSVIMKYRLYAGVRRKADNSALLQWAKLSGLTSRRGLQSTAQREKSQS